tara:strand:- start:747 stop:992 length:246 start_codon:yes stop_codon:yes gene_type:complete
MFCYKPTERSRWLRTQETGRQPERTILAKIGRGTDTGRIGVNKYTKEVIGPVLTKAWEAMLLKEGRQFANFSQPEIVEFGK